MAERRVAGDRRHPLHLPVTTLPQPDETTCGPTCLHAIYRYWGDREPLQSVIDRMWRHNATMAVIVRPTHRIPRRQDVVGIITKEHIADSLAASVKSYRD